MLCRSFMKALDSHYISLLLFSIETMIVTPNFVLICILIGVAAAITVVLKKLTPSGAGTGALLGISVYAGAGMPGLALLATFFIMAVGVTAHKKQWKEVNALSNPTNSRRSAGQVLANGGLAALLSLSVFLLPHKATLLHVLVAACLSSATADTVSSELGVVYGRRFYNVRTFQHDARGLDGVVSREGTLAGLAGSVVIALVHAIGVSFSQAFFIIVIAGTAGNLFDSYLGATWERARYITNDAVNFGNTLLAAIVAFLLLHLFGSPVH